MSLPSNPQQIDRTVFACLVNIICLPGKTLVAFGQSIDGAKSYVTGQQPHHLTPKVHPVSRVAVNIRSVLIEAALVGIASSIGCILLLVVPYVQFFESS